MNKIIYKIYYLLKYILYLARFPLSSEVLGPRVVNFKKVWNRVVPTDAP